MKTILCSFICCLLVLPAVAQDQDLIEYGYLFSEFKQGTARRKSAPPVEGLFNYDVTQQNMQMLDQNGQVSVVGKNDIMVIIIDGRNFVPSQGTADDIFFEGIKTPHGEFYVQHRGRAVSRGKDVGYGMTSETVSVTNISALSSGGAGRVNLSSADKMDIQDISIFYVADNNRFRQINNLSNLTSVFKSHKSQIKAFASENKTKFTDMDDVAAIIDYAYSLGQ